jgi:hypothetical protein
LGPTQCYNRPVLDRNRVWRPFSQHHLCPNCTTPPIVAEPRPQPFCHRPWFPTAPPHLHIHGFSTSLSSVRPSLKRSKHSPLHALGLLLTLPLILHPSMPLLAQVSSAVLFAMWRVKWRVIPVVIALCTTGLLPPPRMAPIIDPSSHRIA